MAKDKKKRSKKDGISDDLLDVAAASLKKFRKVTRQVTKLSTGQKLVGGVALLAVGLTYLAKQQGEATEPTPAPDADPTPELSTVRPVPPPAPNGAKSAPKKARKSVKSKP